MGGVRWHVGDRSDLEDHRCDPPAVREVADAVDGVRMTPRCDHCKAGRIPVDGMRLQVMNMFDEATMYLVLSCVNCRVPLSKASLLKLNQQRLAVVTYRAEQEDP